MKPKIFTRSLPMPGKTARTILRIGIPLILAALAGLVAYYLRQKVLHPALAELLLPELLEYIFASLAVLLGAELLADLTERDVKSREK